MKTSQEIEALRPVTRTIIGCAIEAHRHLGPGLLEQVYEAAVCIELRRADLTFIRQPTFPIDYKGLRIGEHRADLIVANSVVVELKSVERFDPIFAAQVLTYLRFTGLRIGLLINFNSRFLKDGVIRVVL